MRLHQLERAAFHWPQSCTGLLFNFAGEDQAGLNDNRSHDVVATILSTLGRIAQIVGEFFRSSSLTVNDIRHDHRNDE
jgi:hypothetical protein